MAAGNLPADGELLLEDALVGIQVMLLTGKGLPYRKFIPPPEDDALRIMLSTMV